jgi:hypothetical protein
MHKKAQIFIRANIRQEVSMSKRWQEFYAHALLETDEQKLAGRIDTAMSVLAECLQQLGDSPEEVREKQWIRDAVRTLHVLRKEPDFTTDNQDIASEQRRVG